jgi:osmoprotectant transport system permease protein
MSDTVTAETRTGPEQTDQPKRRGATLAREERLLLYGIPVLVALVLGGYVLWRQTAALDSIELRQLAWRAVWSLTWEHIKLTVASTIFVVGIAVPLGVVLTRPAFRSAAPVVVGIANGGQAAPAIGLVVLLAMWPVLGFGFWTGVVAFTLYGVLPVLRNTITGLRAVEPTLVEAGRGMGMSNAGVLFRIELPLAVPVIMTGVRTALVLVVGVAAFATFINAGGLGSLIVTGITLSRDSVLISGALLIAVLALIIEWAGRLLEVATRPKGI